MGKRKNNLFWLSYSDLMTSLFFVMLVLFVLVFVIMQNKTNTLENFVGTLEETQDSLLVALNEHDRIKAINESLKALSDGGNYLYNYNCKRYELDQEILFESNSAIIPIIQRKSLIAAGRDLKQLVGKFKNEKNIKFLIVIEGRAARHEDNRKNLKFANNVKDLSYSRALALYNLWYEAGINFNSRNSEVLISGSGFDGQCRYSGTEEAKNKRFIILIIPYLIK